MPPDTSTVPEPVKLAGVTFLRYVLSSACAILVQKHVIDAGTSTAILDPISILYIGGFLLTVGYGVYLRLKSRFNTNTALTLPPNATPADLKTKVDQATVKEIISTKPAV